MADEPKCIAVATCASGVGEGWYPLVLHTEQLLNIIATGWQADQVKEKFGGLRFYVTWPDPRETHDKRDSETDEEYDSRMNSIVDAWESLVGVIEDASYKICENCGKPGKQHGTGWVHTLCDSCAKGIK